MGGREGGGDEGPRPPPRAAGRLCLEHPQPERGGQTPRPGALKESTTREGKAVSAGPSPGRGLRGGCRVLSSRRNYRFCAVALEAGSASVSWPS